MVPLLDYETIRAAAARRGYDAHDNGTSVIVTDPTSALVVAIVRPAKTDAVGYDVVDPDFEIRGLGLTVRQVLAVLRGLET